MIDCQITEHARTPESRYRRAVSGTWRARPSLAALAIAVGAGSRDRSGRWPGKRRKLGRLPADPALPHLDWSSSGPRLDVYDPVGDALLVAGAIRTGEANVDFDVHLYRLALGGTTGGFTEVPAGNRPRRSSVSGAYPMTYDPAADRLFVQIDGYNAGTKSEIWSVSLGNCR